MKIIIYKDRNKEWRWRVEAKNGLTIGDSSEGYKRRYDCRKMVCKLFDGAHNVALG